MQMSWEVWTEMNMDLIQLGGNSGKGGWSVHVSLCTGLVSWLVCKGEMVVFQLGETDLLGTREFQGLPFNPEVADVSTEKGTWDVRNGTLTDLFELNRAPSCNWTCAPTSPCAWKLANCLSPLRSLHRPPFPGKPSRAP